MLWWESLSTLGQVFACIALPFTIVMLIQTIMLIFGFGGDHGDTDGGDVGMDHDFSHGGHVDMGHDLAGNGDGAIDSDFSDGHDGADMHTGEGHHHMSNMEGADLRLFTIRGIISFMVVLGWIGLLLEGSLPKAWVILISVVSGFAALYLTAKIFQLSKKLQSSGNINMKNAVGTEAQVYLTIPASMSGAGKVHVMVQQRLVECDAVTSHNRPLPTGSTVAVMGIRPDETLIVEPKK